MNKFLIVDASHMFYRSRYSVRGSEDEKVGMCMHVLLSCLSKAWYTQKATHVVFAFDGKSWRKSVYPSYKDNRPEATPEDIAYFNAFNDFKNFVSEKTNCTVLSHPSLEADDLVAGFIGAHPDDQHVIVSGDGDFEQLLAQNVTMYDGVKDETITIHGIYDWKGNPSKDKKTGLPKAAPEPEWSLFEKCIRGCTTDHIFSAYPGVRTKSTAKKIGLREAYEDRNKKGFAWSSIMMHRWLDADNVEHVVVDDYNRNVGLIDLTRQPNNIREMIADTIINNCVPLARTQIGLFLIKFCGKYQLVRLNEKRKELLAFLGAAYPYGGFKE